MGASARDLYSESERAGASLRAGAVQSPDRLLLVCIERLLVRVCVVCCARERLGGALRFVAERRRAQGRLPSKDARARVS